MAKNNNTKLLGRKRETREDEEEDLQELTKTKREKENKKDIEEESIESEAIEAGEEKESQGEESGSEGEESESSKNKEESKEAPKSLFGNVTLPKLGLFGNISGTTEEKKDTKLFSGAGNNLFSSSSLFSGNSLFGGSGNSLFSKPLNFNLLGAAASSSSFISEKKKDEDSEDDGDDNDLFKSSSPSYNPVESQTDTVKQADKGPYTKKFVKELENIFVYGKQDGKFVSKGKGFLSLEYAEIESKKVGVIVFRNTMGSKIIEGFLSPKLKKLEKYVKNFKHVASFSFLQKVGGKFEIAYSKIPFPRENELTEFEKTFNEILDMLKSDVESPKETKN